MPTVSGTLLPDESSTLAITNSFTVKTNESRPTTASTGDASGRTTPQKTCAGVAPSTRADSSSSDGIVSKKPFNNHVLTPITPPRYTTISPVTVLSPITWNTSPTL